MFFHKEIPICSFLEHMGIICRPFLAFREIATILLIAYSPPISPCRAWRTAALHIPQYIAWQPDACVLLGRLGSSYLLLFSLPVGNLVESFAIELELVRHISILAGLDGAAECNHVATIGQLVNYIVVHSVVPVLIAILSV